MNRVQAFYAEATFRPLRPRRRPLSVELPPEEVLAAVDELRPAVLRSYGGYLELLFRVAAATRSLRHRPRVIMYSGDTMSTSGRELIEGEFGIPVVSQYNAVEAFKIAFTCEARSGFHLHEDLCHVWLADPDGRPVEPGQRGEVVLSNLVNRGTVLLNYRPGDVYHYDTFTSAAERRRGISTASQARLFETLHGEGYRRSIRAVLPENRAAVADAARAGYRPIGRIGYVKLGPWRRTFGTTRAA